MTIHLPACQKGGPEGLKILPDNYAYPFSLNWEKGQCGRVQVDTLIPSPPRISLGESEPQFLLLQSG